MIVCWTVKGGSGGSVVSALVAAALARTTPTTLVDLGGDQPSILNAGSDARIGVTHWLNAGSGVLPEALNRLTVPVSENLSLLPAGSAPVIARTVDAESQAQRLAAAVTNAVVDAGIVRASDDLPAQLAQHATASVLIIRTCYLALHRASKLSIRPNGVIVIDEPGRSLDSRDVADVLGVPVLATLPWDASVARFVDAGRLLARKSKTSRAIERLANDLVTPVDAVDDVA